MRRLAVIAVALAALLAPAAQAATKQATAVGRGGAAATVDLHGTAAAIEILRKGGNATDAAVAAAAVLGVVEPYSCGIGGGGFWVSYDRATRRVTTIDGRERAPAAMRPGSFMEGGRALTMTEARWSGLSAGVPGTVSQWARALRRDGSMTLAQVLAPAIRIARRGFLVDQTFYDQTQAAAELFDDVPSTRALYLDADGTPRDVGTRIRNPDLARTYELIARRGERGFYRGALARAIAAAAQTPPVDAGTGHAWRPGLMTAADLRRYRARVRPPVSARYRGLKVFGMGPPSSGGTTVLEALNVLEGYRPLGADRPEALHRMIEASRLSFADRNAYIADPAFADVPVPGLLSDDYAAQRRSQIGPTAATSPVAPGDPPGQSTTHITVADHDRNVVTYTFTIESTGGNGIVVPGYGFLLNNELTDFNYDSLTHPNRADSRKRPRSSIAPTIVLLRDGRPALAVGSPGGATIITTVLGILVHRFDLGDSLPAAIAAPRISQRNQARTQVEPGYAESPEGVALAGRGHRFTVSVDAGGEIGAATGIELRRGGRFLAAAEPVRRGGGSALVVRR
jgi:gamma-glutamyltranspeptidase/glutathione hydrolase